MPDAYFLSSRKFKSLQTTIAAEANTDAGATWGAAESTLANDLKVKVNAVLAALRGAGILSTTGSGRITYTQAIRGSSVQTNVADEATADSDATYGQPEADLLNSMKTKVNSIITAMTSARIIGGHNRFRYLNGQRSLVTSGTAVAAISIANADATYTGTGVGEQGLTNDIKAKINLIIAALKATKLIA